MVKKSVFRFPTVRYLNIIKKGYKDCKLDNKFLLLALKFQINQKTQRIMQKTFSTRNKYFNQAHVFYEEPSIHHLKDYITIFKTLKFNS